MNYAIAIDIGGTNTRVALIDENYEIEERRQFATDAQDPFVTIEEIRKTIDCYSSPEAVLRGTACRKLIIKRYTDKTVSSMLLETVLSYGQQ